MVKQYNKIRCRLLISLALSILGSWLLYVVFNRTMQRGSLSQNSQLPVISPSQTSVVPFTLQPGVESSGTFTHPAYHYSIQYPKTWRLQREIAQNGFVTLWPSWDENQRYFQIRIEPPKRSDLSISEYERESVGTLPTRQWTETIGINQWSYFYPDPKDASPFYAMLAYSKVNGIIYTFVVQPYEYPQNTPDPVVEAHVSETNQVFRFVLQSFQAGN